MDNLLRKQMVWLCQTRSLSRPAFNRLIETNSALREALQNTQFQIDWGRDCFGEGDDPSRQKPHGAERAGPLRLVANGSPRIAPFLPKSLPKGTGSLP